MQDAKMTQQSPSRHHGTNLLGCIFATKPYIVNRKKLLSSNTSSTNSLNIVNFGPLTVEIGSGVWGTPVNFNGFCVLPSLLQRRRSLMPTKLCTTFGRLKSNQIKSIYFSVGWYTIYTFSGALVPWQNFARCKIHFTSKSCVLLY